MAEISEPDNDPGDSHRREIRSRGDEADRRLRDETASGVRAAAPTRSSFERWTRKPVGYRPVWRGDELIGLLWFSQSYSAAGFIRRFPEFAADLAVQLLWDERLEAAYREGLSPRAAVLRWVGVAEDRIGGGIPRHAREGAAPDLPALWRRLNPNGPRLGTGPLIQDGMFPDGSPADRIDGWDAIAPAPPPPTYRADTAGTVRYVRVIAASTHVGYLWAAVTDHAADYLPRATAGRQGQIAAGMWRARLSDAYATGRSALAALSYCATFPEHRLAGRVARDTRVEEVSGLGVLVGLAHS